MTDPFWSLPIGRWSGSLVRLHGLLIAFLMYQIFWSIYDQSILVTLCWLGLFLYTLFLHELAHRWVESHTRVEPSEIKLWPLGNMTRPTWTACMAESSERFLIALAGPLVNLVLALLGILVLLLEDPQLLLPMILGGSSKAHAALQNPFTSTWMAWTFGQINLFFFGINLLPAFPMDGGHMLRSLIANPRLGLTRDSLVEAWTARTCAVLLLIAGVVKILGFHAFQGGMVFIFLAIVVEWTARLESTLAEDDGFFEDGVFSYDFSEGYTSLEKSTSHKVRRRTKPESALKRWRRRRAMARDREDAIQVAADADRLDQLLEKIHRVGRDSLSQEENLFLIRISQTIRSLRISAQGGAITPQSRSHASGHNTSPTPEEFEPTEDESS